MANELSTVVPVQVQKVRGVERLLTENDIAILIGRPVRWVREKLLKTKILPSVKFGGNSYRVQMRHYVEMLDKGKTGFNHAPPSGRRN